LLISIFSDLYQTKKKKSFNKNGKNKYTSLLLEFLSNMFSKSNISLFKAVPISAKPPTSTSPANVYSLMPLKGPSAQPPSTDFSPHSRPTSAAAFQPPTITHPKFKRLSSHQKPPTDTEPTQAATDANLFFNFSKLVALESSMNNTKQTIDETVQLGLRRPRTAHASLAIPTVNLNIQEQVLKLNGTAQKQEQEQLEVFGDQEAYKKLFQDNREADWLELPDEIWLKILKMLKQSDLACFGLTCKKFQKLYMDSSLCKCLNKEKKV